MVDSEEPKFQQTRGTSMTNAVFTQCSATVCDSGLVLASDWSRWPFGPKYALECTILQPPIFFRGSMPSIAYNGWLLDSTFTAFKNFTKPT